MYVSGTIFRVDSEHRFAFGFTVLSAIYGTPTAISGSVTIKAILKNNGLKYYW